MTDAAWPPYSLVEDELDAPARRAADKLERLYHVGQENAWDGRAILAALVAQHGPPRFRDPATEASALKLLAVLLWGELAAWSISADLAERLDDVDAKMAATSQAHDEARHFTVLRDYVHAITATTGARLPRLGRIARGLLHDLITTDSLVHKLIGMQLLVEVQALSIFRALAEADVEPVLTGLLPYIERDEARHVGLGVMYLPRLLPRLSRVERARAIAFQLRCVGALISGGLTMRDDFRRLGIDERKMATGAMRFQDQILRDMRSEGAPGLANRRAATAALLNPSRGFGPRVIGFFHPDGGMAAAPPWHQLAFRVCQETARLADRL
jgi:hypothetical protein